MSSAKNHSRNIHPFHMYPHHYPETDPGPQYEPVTEPRLESKVVPFSPHGSVHLLEEHLASLYEQGWSLAGVSSNMLFFERPLVKVN